MSSQTDIVNYWSVQPPFKAEQGEPGTLEWSRSVAEHRYRVIPYLPAWADFAAARGKRVLEAGEIRERLWFFSRADAAVDYCVYDTPDERKLPGNHTMDVERTGVSDVDIFFEQFNDSVRTGRDLRPFGWHLLVDAIR